MKWLATLLLLLCFVAPAAQAPVIVLRIDGAIGPASADYVLRGLQRAERDGAVLVVLELDTPGGLDTSMRSIIKAILASRVPVAGYVWPKGARAASAGTYLLYASHVAAMAPATNLGAATPVAIGLPGLGGNPSEAPASGASAPAAADPMSAKRVSDAVAYIRGLAKRHGRNVEWAEKAVREAASLPADEALERHVVDVVAADVNDLLRQIDGRILKDVDGRTLTLAVAGAPLVAVEPDWRSRVLAALSDPSIAVVLMMIGLYGLVFEFANPGFVVPGVVGAVCLLLGIFGLQMLPISYVGLALLLLGIAFMVGEAFVPSFGALGIGGVVAVALGLVMLVDTDAPGFTIPTSLIAALSLCSAAFVVGVAMMAAKARARRIVSGDAALVGSAGELIEADGVEGYAEVAGERWRVHSAQTLTAGQRVHVVAVDGLVLEVTADSKGG